MLDAAVAGMGRWGAGRPVIHWLPPAGPRAMDRDETFRLQPLDGLTQRNMADTKL